MRPLSLVIPWVEKGRQRRRKANAKVSSLSHLGMDFMMKTGKAGEELVWGVGMVRGERGKEE